MVRPRMALGSLLLVVTLATAACAERETARAGTEPSVASGETAQRPSMQPTAFPTSGRHALEDCPVHDEAFCRIAVEMVNAIEAGDAETIVLLSRPDEYDCGVVQSELFPGCVTTDVVLHGYIFMSGVFPTMTIDVLSSAEYLARLEAMFASVDVSYADEYGGGAPTVVGVKRCGGDWTITWTAAWSENGDPVQRMAGSFGFVVPELGSDEWFTAGPWTMPLAYPQWDSFQEGTPPLDEIACNGPTMAWPS